nr:hypothetical protein [uncultured Psychroserpens sp.]
MTNEEANIVLFLKKINFFVLSSICVMVLLVILTTIYVSNSLDNYKLNQSIDTIIIGHSHSELAYNSKILNNTYNLSESSDAYFYTYLKLKAIVKANPQIKNIFIEFSNMNISELMDDWTWDDRHLNKKFTKFSGFIGFDDTKVLLKNNFKGYLKTVGLSVRKNFELILNPRKKIYLNKQWGEFRPKHGSILDSILESSYNSIDESNDYYRSGLSNINIEYLKKIVSFLQARNISVSLIRTPVHITDDYLVNEASYLKIYKENFVGIPLLDFKDYPLLNEQYFDKGHVNYSGSEEISEFLKALIDTGILKSNHQQKRIDSLIRPLIKKRSEIYNTSFGYSKNHN